MLSILIIEDEQPARQKLKRLLAAITTGLEIAGEVDTVAGAVNFLQQQQPDLIFSDIELLDGNAFDIFQQVQPKCPVIFTTAYNQFWMDAFEHCGIDYLLKPFSAERFQKAWDKYQWLRSQASQPAPVRTLLQLVQQQQQAAAYKTRFTVRKRQHLYFLETQQIVWLEARDGVVLAFDTGGKKHVLTHESLTAIEAQLNPVEFFRIHRSCIISKQHIEKLERFNKNALSVKMKGYPQYHSAAQANTATFRQWIDT